MAATKSLILLCLIVIVKDTYSQWAFPRSDEQTNSDCCEEYCYMHDTDPYLFVGTKTAYEFIYGRSSRHHVVPKCSPVQFWSMNRHGTRLPSQKSIRILREQMPKLRNEIISNYEVRRSYPDRGKMCQADLDGLREWVWDGRITEDKGNMLTEQGKDDLKYIAKRYQTRFTDLLGKPYTEKDYIFQYTNTERTEDSFKAFAEGLFGGSSKLVQPIIVSENNSIIKPYEDCPTWEDNKNDDKEVKRFEETNDMKSLVRDVGTRLGFRYALNVTSVKLMYDMCRFERAWHVTRSSPWCAVFTRNQLLLLEYLEDLKYYYKTGYGNPLSAQLGCMAVKDLLERFEKVASENSDQPTGVFYFTHSAALQMLLVALDFAHDVQPLHADNLALMSRRKWRTSVISPFAANLAAAFYKCDNGEKNVMFFINENPVEYSGCKVGLCTWGSVQRRLREVAENCNLDVCVRAGSESHKVLFSIIAVLFIITRIIT